MLKARSPDITQYHYGDRYYKIYDAYPGYEYALGVAEDCRKQPCPLDCRYTCRAIVVDLGPDAGRLRYGLFVAKGKLLPKR